MLLGVSEVTAWLGWAAERDLEEKLGFDFLLHVGMLVGTSPSWYIGRRKGNQKCFGDLTLSLLEPA